MLRIYNTLSRQKETFTPIEAGKVKLYVCGMTVYDLCHLGHARVLIAFDVFYRFLQKSGYDVTYVRNITDIDDKIIARANEKGQSIFELTQYFTDEMHKDADALHVLPPNYEPKATDNIKEIIEMIETLFTKDLAYQGKSGDVYYKVADFKNYGQLSGKNIEDLRAGERVEINTDKNDALDFVLWKGAKEGEPFWESPWGKGRPGWHIECSAMSVKQLGNHFDIHGGGMDLQFPHHENEIAQSEGATCEKFVNYWMHNGFVRIDDEKMSKSLGNFFTIREVLKLFTGEEIRYFVLGSQYRSPLNYSDQALNNAKSGLTRLYQALKGIVTNDFDVSKTTSYTRFMDAMNDDMNTPEALSVLFDLAHKINKETDTVEKQNLATTLVALGDTLGILQCNPKHYLQGSVNTDGISTQQIETLIAKRKQARADKDWALGDKIRDDLLAQGIELEDGAQGTTWRR